MKESKTFTKEQLMEFVDGVKPLTQIGAVVTDGLFPASQFHFSVKSPERHRQPLTPEQKDKITEALKIPLCGMVDIQFAANRVIVTTVCHASEREYWGAAFSTAIDNTLKG